MGDLEQKMRKLHKTYTAPQEDNRNQYELYRDEGQHEHFERNAMRIAFAAVLLSLFLGSCYYFVFGHKRYDITKELITNGSDYNPYAPPKDYNRITEQTTEHNPKNKRDTEIEKILQNLLPQLDKQ